MILLQGVQRCAKWCGCMEMLAASVRKACVVGVGRKWQVGGRLCVPTTVLLTLIVDVV